MKSNKTAAARRRPRTSGGDVKDTPAAAVVRRSLRSLGTISLEYRRRHGLGSQRVGPRRHRPSTGGSMDRRRRGNTKLAEQQRRREVGFLRTSSTARPHQPTKKDRFTPHSR